MSKQNTISVGLIGFGYWGPNLARNFNSSADYRLACICDQSENRLEQAKALYPATQVTSSHKELLEDNSIDLVAIATPVSTHYPLALEAIKAGKHVLIEKPITEKVQQAEELLAAAEAGQCRIFVDHTFLYTGAVLKIRELIHSGELGEIRYIDAVRINLGLFQSDVNVLSDLGPHDISILDFFMERPPIACRALGGCQAGTAHEDITYLYLEYDDGTIAHIHWNWLAPVKIRQMLIGGTKKMVVYDDMERSEKLKVYDKGVDIIEGDEQLKRQLLVDYRIGDMIAPKLDHGEALAVQISAIADQLRTNKPSPSDGETGLRVLKVMEAAQRSLKSGGERVVI